MVVAVGPARPAAADLGTAARAAAPAARRGPAAHGREHGGHGRRAGGGGSRGHAVARPAAARRDRRRAGGSAAGTGGRRRRRRRGRRRVGSDSRARAAARRGGAAGTGGATGGSAAGTGGGTAGTRRRTAGRHAGPQPAPITGSATRPQLTAGTDYTILKYFEKAGSLVDRPDHRQLGIRPRASATCRPSRRTYTVAATGGTHTTVQAALTAARRPWAAPPASTSRSSRGRTARRFAIKDRTRRRSRSTARTPTPARR